MADDAHDVTPPPAPHRKAGCILYLPPGSLVSFHHSSVNEALSIGSIC